LPDGGVDAQALKLHPRDELTIYSENELQDLPAVTVEGTVRESGRYPLSSGMELSVLTYEAGGLKEEAYQERAQLVRTSVVNGSDIQFA
jgi:protein involved in polysaccharide export with SLBB domain